jgi:hypothetical protein
MGIFKKLINKVLDTEVPPAVEKLVKKGLSKKEKSGVNLPDTSPFAIEKEDGSGLVSINYQIQKTTDDLWGKIPDDVKELLFCTWKTPRQYNHTGLNTITINFDGKDFNTRYNDHVMNDPSTIYFQLPLKIPRDVSVVSKLPYMPSYIGITPEQRYIYLTWLQDISRDIDVGYKFLFYYGLERMLIIGNHEKAFDAIIKLRKNTDNKSFQAYSGNAVFYTGLRIGKEEMLDKLRFLFDDEVWYDKQIMLKLLNHEPIEPCEVIKILKGLNVNKRYLDEKAYLEQIGKLFSEKYGHFFLLPQEIIDETTSSVETDTPVFANFSLPEKLRTARLALPELNNFSSTIIDLHRICHERTKERLAEIRKKK